MLSVVGQDDGGQQRPQTVNIPVETEKLSADSAMITELRNSLQSMDEMKRRFVEERDQWSAERDQLKTTRTEVPQI